MLILFRSCFVSETLPMCVVVHVRVRVFLCVCVCITNLGRGGVFQKSITIMILVKKHLRQAYFKDPKEQVPRSRTKWPPTLIYKSHMGARRRRGFNHDAVTRHRSQTDPPHTHIPLAKNTISCSFPETGGLETENAGK